MRQTIFLRKMKCLTNEFYENAFLLWRIVLLIGRTNPSIRVTSGAWNLKWLHLYLCTVQGLCVSLLLLLLLLLNYIETLSLLHVQYLHRTHVNLKTKLISVHVRMCVCVSNFNWIKLTRVNITSILYDTIHFIIIHLISELSSSSFWVQLS